MVVVVGVEVVVWLSLLKFTEKHDKKLITKQTQALVVVSSKSSGGSRSKQ